MSNISLTDGHIDNAEHCVCCGAVIPEGRQVCVICGLKTNYKQSTVNVVEVRHGEWVYNRGQAFGEPCYFCSLCIDGGSDNGRDNYCPNCGAKMDGKDGE